MPDIFEADLNIFESWFLFGGRPKIYEWICHIVSEVYLLSYRQLLGC